MCSCSKLMMLEVGEPGELPLMKELTTLKKSKPKKSPLLEGAVSPNTQEGVCMQPLEDEGRASREHHTKEYSQEYAFHGAWDSNMEFRRDGAKGASRRNSKSPQSTPTQFDPTNIRSPPMNDFNSKIMNWVDVSGDASKYIGSERATKDCLQRESLRNHLEKLGILGEGQGLDAHNIKETSLLHNWRNASDDWQSHAIHAETFELEPSAHAWNQQEHLHDHAYLKNHADNFLVCKDGHGERETLVNQKSSSRQTKGDRWWRANTQTLSPLVLHPHDENHRFGHAEHAFFTLDQEHSDNDDDEDYEEKHIRAENQVQHGKFVYQKEVPQAGTNGGSRLRSPLHSHKKQAAPNGTRFSKMSPQGFRPGTSETEFLEYDVEALEQPSKRKETGKSYDQRPLNHNQPVKRQSFTQENPRSSGNAMQSTRRNSASFYERPPIVQRQSSKSASIYTLRSPEIEPLPLLTELEDYNGSDEYGGSSNEGDFGRSSMSELQGELDLKARKNGHNAGRLADSGDAEQLQLAVRDCKELALCEYHPRNLSQKYRPKAFEEVVGQHIVTQALSNAIIKGRIAPVYLFQGPRGTGKTSAARIFASALICISSEGKRPCGACRECISVALGKSSEVKEVDAASNNGIERVKVLLEETISAPPLSRYKIFIIDECHVLTTETWNALLKVLEEPPMNVVFILITTDADQLPRTTLSRCQKFPFPKIKETEIVKRLQKLASMENLSVDLEILQLIASRSDGSLRDAETILDQITLLGQHVNPSTLHELVGCAPDDKMLGLLEASLVADTVNTVRRARELVDSGMEPLSLMSRIATLITDILAGSFRFTENQRRGFFQKQPLSDEKLERLRMAMKILSEAEKQLRVSNDRTTWLTAALLQLGPDRMCMFSASCAGTSVTQSPVALDDIGENEVNDYDQRSTEKRATWADNDANQTQEFDSKFAPQDGKAARQRNNAYAHEKFYWTDAISQENAQGKGQLEHGFIETQVSHGSEQSRLEDDPLDISFKDPTNEQRLSPTKLDDIWGKVIDRCRSLPLQQLLDASVTLTSISITEVDATIHLEVGHPAHKSSCERSEKSIAYLFEMVLGFPVDIKISLASLPAEGEDLRTTQGSAGKHIHIYPEGASPEGYDCRKQESITKSHIPHQTHATKSFPAIPPGAASLENQPFVASTWNSVTCANGGKRTEHQSATHKVECATLLQDPRGLSPMTASASEGTATYRVRGQHHKGDTNGYIHNQAYDDINTKEERIMDEVEGLSPNSFEVHDKSRLRQCACKGSKGGQAPHGIDGHKSCDAEAKQKEGSSKMVRRLSIRNHARSSDPNSPDEKGSYLRVPRFSIKSHTNPQKYKDLQSPKEESEQFVDPEEAATSSTQKKGILKGAVGGFARLFQGKLSK